MPEQPDRQTELDYMEWLQEDIKSDKWLTFRPRKLQAGPKRVPYKNYYTLKSEYRMEWAQWFLIGGIAAWPVAVWVGNNR